MSRQALEVADILRAQGQVWRQAHAGHISLGQLKVMSSIETCRSAALGGHVLRCSACAHQQIAYNSCRNRHCPRCQGSAAHRWLEARQADLLPVEYYHLVFTLPAPVWPLQILYRRIGFGYRLAGRGCSLNITQERKWCLGCRGSMVSGTPGKKLIRLK